MTQKVRLVELHQLKKIKDLLQDLMAQIPFGDLIRDFLGLPPDKENWWTFFLRHTFISVSSLSEEPQKRHFILLTDLSAHHDTPDAAFLVITITVQDTNITAIRLHLVTESDFEGLNIWIDDETSLAEYMVSYDENSNIPGSYFFYEVAGEYFTMVQSRTRQQPQLEDLVSMFYELGIKIYFMHVAESTIWYEFHNIMEELAGKLEDEEER